MRNGTMVKVNPVETGWIWPFRRDFVNRDSDDARDVVSRKRSFEFRIALAHFHRTPDRPLDHRRCFPEFAVKRTGIFPAFKSRVISAGFLDSDAYKYSAVPSVGCPANGNSASTVKMRTFFPSELQSRHRAAK